MVKRQKRSNSYSFTSESVCAGHPDKICDQISDAIVDAVLEQDPKGHVAVETLATQNKVIIAGEISSKAKIDPAKIAKEQIKRLGYTDPVYGFTHESDIQIHVHQQSPDIAVGVDNEGAGDQGMMFGFACNETQELMPLPISLAHELALTLDQVREKNILPYLRPDGKTQVTVDYKNGKPIRVRHVVIAVPHEEKISLAQLTSDVFNCVVEPVVQKFGFSVPRDEIIVNGTGVWHIGGPATDTGLTGRKIIVDSYGGYARVGGGAFSGKDPTKVDRSGAYAARYIAKNIVAHGLADKVEVSLAYVIGRKEPLMINFDTFSTEKASVKAIKDFASKLIDTSVTGILEKLKLRAPIYLQTASYGHFGKRGLPWEEIS